MKEAKQQWESGLEREWEKGVDAIAQEFNLSDAQSYARKYNTAKGRSQKLRDKLKEKYGVKKMPSGVWWNKRAIRDDDGKKIHEGSQEILDKLFAERFSDDTVVAVESLPEKDTQPPTTKSVEPPPAVEEEKTTTEALPETPYSAEIEEALASEPVQVALKRLGMERDRFIVEAIYAYGRANQGGNDAEISKLSTTELMGSRKRGYGEALVERAVRAVMEWNSQQQSPDLRYQITYPIVKELTQCSTAVMARVLGNPTGGIQGSMVDEINDHHEMLGMVSKVYNRGKDPISKYLKVGEDF